MRIIIELEVDEGDPNVDPNHSTGLTNEAYEKLTSYGPHSLSWLGEVQDITKEERSE